MLNYSRLLINIALFKVFLVGILLSISANAGSNNSLVYHGSIKSPDGTSINSGTVTFNLKVYGRSARYWDGVSLQSGTERCLLYQETHSKNMTGSKGTFELLVGEGSSPTWGTGAAASDKKMSRIMMNNPLDTGNYIPAISCATGTALYFPFGPDATAPEWVDRELVVTITPQGVASFTLDPVIIKAQPYALQAGQVGGFSPNSLFRISGTSNNKFSVSQHDFLATSLLPGLGATTRIVGLPAIPLSADEATSKAYVDAALAGAISGAGGVTDVTGVAPIQSSGGSTPAISISQASATIPGYLSAADWTTFNNKLSTTSVFAGDVSGPYNAIVINAGVITTAKISDAAVTYAKIQNVTTGYILGRSTAGAGSAEEISLGSGLSLAGGILSTTSAGTVTSVTGTGPITSSGGATPAISISQADATHDGYLSSTNWSLFNSKLGAITGVGSISIAGNAISISQASTNTNGILSSTDWNLFNNKIGANNVRGTGAISFDNSGTGVISISTASTGVSGMLTSTDWNTFNTKLGAITGVGSISTNGNAISISTAATGVNGILSSTDWNLFNNKVSASNLRGTGNVSIDNSAATPSVQISAGQGYLIGRVNAGGAGIATDISIGGGLSMSAGGVLSASGSGLVASVTGTGIINASAGSNPAISISTTGANGAYVNGGNSFGVNASIGTNDSHPLAFKTNNVTAMSISQNGYVGIGTANPIDDLSIYQSGAGGAWMMLGTDGTGANSSVGLSMVTKWNGADLPAAGNKGWNFSAQGDAVGFGQANDLYFDYWNGATHIIPIYLDSASSSVGIFTINPSSALEVSGAITVPATGAPGVAASNSGRIYYDSGTQKFMVSTNGTAYSPLATAAGAVASVTGAGAISSSGGINPSISISTAATGVNGILSSTDWNLFNNKVSSNLLRGAGPVSLDNSGSSPVISVSFAATGASGLLSSTDWNTFNNKISSNAIRGIGSISFDNSGNGAISISTAATGVSGMLTSTDWNTFNDKIGAASVFAGDVSGTYNTNFIIPAAVTYAKIQNIPEAYLMGRINGSGAGVASSISIGSGLAMSAAGVLSTSFTAQQVSDANGYVLGGNAFGVNATIGTQDNRPLAIMTNNSPALTISQNGYVGIGQTTPTSGLHMLNSYPTLDADTNNATGMQIKFRKNRSGGLVVDQDNLGNINFEGHDGAGYYTAAQIKATVQGTAGSTSVPGMLSFHTRDLSGGLQNRMAVLPNGNVGIRTTTAGSALEVSGTARATRIMAGTANAPVMAWTPVAKAANYSILSTDVYTFFVVTGTSTLTLPSPAAVGSGYTVGFNNAGAGVVTIARNAAETINGATSATIAVGETTTLITDGTNWFFFNRKSASNPCSIVESEYIDGADNAYGAVVWQQGSYVYLSQDTPKLFADDVTTGVRVGTPYSFAAGRTPNEGAIWGDGTYIYVGAANYLYAFSFNGTTFTAVSVNTGQPVYDVWGSGSYIYIANGTAGIKAYTFDGTTLAQAGATYNTPGTATRIWANSSGHIFSIEDGDAIYAFTFNGATFTKRDEHYEPGGHGGFQMVTGDGNYIIASYYWGDSTTSAADVLTFNGTSFTDTGVKTAAALTASGGFLYGLPEDTSVAAYSFDGTNTVFKMAYSAPGAWMVDINVGADGKVYTAGSFGGIRRFPKCQ